jgi:rubrerythrin
MTARLAEHARLTRSGFLVSGVLAVGAAWGAGAAGPFVRRALAQGGDLQILDFALTLAQLETALYRRSESLPLSPDVLRLTRHFGNHEQQHADALAATIQKLGGSPPPRPSFSLTHRDEKGFLQLAQTVEETAVGSYNGAIPLLRSRELVAALASIAQVEARHAATIRLARGEQASPQAFDTKLSRADALEAVRPLIER